MRRDWLELLSAVTDDLSHDDGRSLHAHVAAELAAERRAHPRVLVFLSGTSLTHGDAPADGAVEKLQGWSDQGAHIAYLSVHRDPARVASSVAALRTSGFPAGPVLYRRDEETYGDVVERAAPDVLIEDDCSGSGRYEIAYDQVEPTLRGRIVSVIVPEFGGLGQLPAGLGSLAPFA